MAEGGVVCQIGGMNSEGERGVVEMDSEEMEIEEGHGDSFKSSFLKKCGDLGDSYIDIHVEEDSEEDPDEDTSNFKKPTKNQDLPISDNWQDVLEWLYKKLKAHFSMDDLVMSLQYIINGGGEDNIADGGRVFKTASAFRSLSKDEDMKEAAFEIESVDEENDKEEEEEWEEDDHEEVEVEEDGVIASRSLNSPYLSYFLSIDTREDIGSCFLLLLLIISTRL
jgi:hypothetical protein